MNWAILVVAGIIEVGWAIGLKYKRRLQPTVAQRPGKRGNRKSRISPKGTFVESRCGAVV